MSASILTPTKCPSTMCPLFAPEGSPWTGNKDSVCPQKPAHREGIKETDMTGCGFWSECSGKCDGTAFAKEQISEVIRSKTTIQLGPLKGRDIEIKPGSTFDCPKALECQWQKQSGESLCPPRYALFLGIDPRFAAY